MTQDSDAQLAARAQGGEAIALQRLIERHYAPVYRLCYRYTGVREDAEDVAQEVFTRLGKAIFSFRGDAGFRTWLMRITVNTLHDEFRRNKRKWQHETAFSDGFDAASDDASQEEILQKKQALQAVHRLPEKLKQAALLVYGEGLSHAEAGKILGCSEGTISWRLSEVRKKLLNVRDKIMMCFMAWAF